MDSAPVEPDFSLYLEHAGKLLGLELAPEHAPGVAANLRLLHGIAAPLLAFPISEHEEAAAVFVP